jgi:asparagine synthase (glutamine-hydrolysing)
MTIVAGILARRPDIPIRDSACEELKGLLSRQQGEVMLFRDNQVFLAKMDVGAYGEAAYRVSPSGTVTLLAGEPLLEPADGRVSSGRAQELEWLHDAWDGDNWGVLQQTHGVFCAVYYQPHKAAITLVVDKLGIRPIYYWADESHFIFSSALRVFEQLTRVPKTLDLRGVTEIVAFGYPLGTRTAYSDIRTPRAAEIVQCCEGDIKTRQYWRWDTIPVCNRPDSELLKELHERFMRAIVRRLRSDKTAVALLSGGLDSRCVVAGLRALQTRVLSFNFSAAGSQDLIFAAEFAAKIGTLHQETIVRIGDPESYDRLAKAWQSSKHRRQWPPERPNIVWSGNGGSLGLGHIYMRHPEVIALLRSGRLDDAIERYSNVEKKHVFLRLLQPRIRTILSDVLHVGMQEEFRDINCEDPGRGLYIFLLLNDQRRHLVAHFENIDHHHIEFHQPFYDSDVLQLIISTPLDLCIGHRFYNRWLKFFQPAVTAVPWQSYPGHEPCPLPVPAGLNSAWGPVNVAALRRAEKNSLLSKAGEMLGSTQFPEAILNKSYLRLARFVYCFGLRKCDYLLEAGLTYHRYWKACNGNYVTHIE